MNSINNIDCVVPYCNSFDLQWVNSYKKYLNSINKNVSDGYFNGRYVDSIDIIKYFLRSVDKYLPWINNLFLVVDNKNQIPDYIDTSKINIVTHDEIIPRELLPCFNSITIEHYISKISNLSEKFLYGNDDFIALKPLNDKMFFADNDKLNIGIKKLNYDGKWNYGKILMNSWNFLYQKNNKKIPDDFNTKAYEQTNLHTFRPNLKSVRNEILEKYENEIKYTFSKIRQEDNMTNIEVPYYYLNNYMVDKVDLPKNFHQYLEIQSDADLDNFNNIVKNDDVYTIVLNKHKNIYNNDIKSILDKKFNFKSKYER